MHKTMIYFLLSLLIPANIITFTQADFQEHQLDRLAWAIAGCESSQIPDLKVLDSNNEYSFGMLQIQQKTWNWGCKRFNLKCTDIQDYEQGRELFKAFYKVGEWEKHWYNCSNKII